MMWKVGFGIFVAGGVPLMFSALAFNEEKAITGWVFWPGAIGLVLMISGVILGITGWPKLEHKSEETKSVSIGLASTTMPMEIEGGPKRGKIYPPSKVYNRNHRRKK